MSNVRQMVVLPYDLEQNSNQNKINKNVDSLKNNLINKNNANKTTRIIKIALKLASINAFNDKLNVKQSDGTFNLSSNLAKLLSITQLKTKNAPGMPDLIHQLYLAKIEPDFIINEIVKQNLLTLINSNSINNNQNNVSENSVSQNTNLIKHKKETELINSNNKSKIKKRKHLPDFDEYLNQSPNKKIIIDNKTPDVNNKLIELEKQANEKLWQIPFTDEEDEEL